MTNPNIDSPIANIAQTRLDRRNFFRKAGYFGLGAAVSGIALSGKPAQAQESAQSMDTTAEILTAFLIDYLRAALTEEFIHANFLRIALTGSQNNRTADPYQTFYFPDGTFATLANFLGILNALENAFIGAYLTAVQEFSNKAASAAKGTLTGPDAKYSSAQYSLLAKQFASILGIESEHRVLGRVIGNENPANNLVYESVDGLTSIYNGTSSAVVALTPFLTESTGPAYSLATAISAVPMLSVEVTDVAIYS